MPTPPDRCTFSPICAHRTDRGPRVDHRVLADAGTDVDVARHHHDAAVEERTEPRRRARHHPHTRRLVVALERDLVGELVGPELDRGHLRLLEVEQDRLLEPLVHDRLAVGAPLGHAGFTLVEQADGVEDGLVRIDVVGLQVAPSIPEVFDGCLQVGHGPAGYRTDSNGLSGGFASGAR